jgi:hypothetical protein
MELQGLEIQKTVASVPMTERLLQAVPLGALEPAAREQIAELHRPFIEHLSSDSEGRKQFENFARLGRADFKRRDAGLARLAVLYVESIGHKLQVDELPERTGYSASAIPKLITEARR